MGLTELNAIGDLTASNVAVKAELYDELLQAENYTRLKLAADAWCAAFVIPKASDHPMITDSTIRSIGQGNPVAPDVLASVQALAGEYQFLHPHLVFSDVFERGDGFDITLGNPPWGQVQYDPRDTFAVSHPDIPAASNMAARNRLIDALIDSEPETHARYLRDRNRIDGTKHFIHASGKYSLSSVGRLNTAPLFVELMRNSINPRGRVGVIVPTGLATDSFKQGFFNDMISRRSLVSLYDFENQKPFFPSVTKVQKFCLLTLAGQEQPAKNPNYVFFAREIADVDDHNKQFALSPDDFSLLNPNTRTAPIFRQRRDAEITTAIYRRVPILVRERDPVDNPWDLNFQLMFMMNTDSYLFRTRSQLEREGWRLQGNHFFRKEDRYMPLYVLGMIHHFDHRWATYENGKFRDVTEIEKQDPSFLAQPQYWVPASEASARIGDERSWLIGWRDIARSRDQRTFIVSPHPRTGIGNPLPQLVFPLIHLRRSAAISVALNSRPPFCLRLPAPPEDRRLTPEFLHR